MRLWETYFRTWDRISGSLSTKTPVSRYLWETYFRTWDRMSGFLSTKRLLSERGRKSIQGDERVNDYYGYLCNKDLCIGV